MTTIERYSAMPEFLAQRPGTDLRSWEVEQGIAARGEAWTDLDNRRMRVPFGDDEFSRVIRAHELMHAQVSPVNGTTAVEKLDCSRIAGVMAEEFRINTLCARQGFNMDLLADGSERKAGGRAAERDDWPGAVAFLAAVAGTKAATDYIGGVRKVNPDWASALTKVNRALINAAKKIGTRNLGDVRIDEESDLPIGFKTHTSKFAKIIDAAIKAGEKTVDDDELGEKVDAKTVGTMIDSIVGKAGAFAPLALDETVALTRHVKGNLGRKRIATNVGRNPRRLHRALTDPERRVFDRTVRGQGGIILIDQSGSMSMSDEQIWDLVNTAPGCVIIGYSHAGGRYADQPNTWVLAERGRVCEEIRPGNGGNGVDGPALRFALSKRKHNEPVIWVCDGMVTDGAGDNWYDNLGEECTELVIKHGVHMVHNVSHAVQALERVKCGQRLSTLVTGYMTNTKTWQRYIVDHPVVNPGYTY